MKKRHLIFGLLSLAVATTAQTKSKTWNPNVSKTENKIQLLK